MMKVREAGRINLGIMASGRGAILMPFAKQ